MTTPQYPDPERQVPTPAPQPQASRGGGVGSAVLPAGGVILLLIVARWIWGLLPGQGPGPGQSHNTGPDNSNSTNPAMVSTDQTPATPATLPSLDLPALSLPHDNQPVEVTIRQDRYMLGATAVQPSQIISALLAQPSSSTSARVKIVTVPDSRIGSEKALESQLDSAHIAYSRESRPDTQP